MVVVAKWTGSSSPAMDNPESEVDAAVSTGWAAGVFGGRVPFLERMCALVGIGSSLLFLWSGVGT